MKSYDGIRGTYEVIACIIKDEERYVFIMRMFDLIEKKKQGISLTKEEISFMIEQYVKGEIPDYQMSAMLMAIYFKGMENEELTNLTLTMAHSGDVADLSPIEGIKVDKHSTGGVGDKTTLVIAPLVAACGAKVAKMSGRGLGHTGGTVDKLESIPGFRTDLPEDEFFKVVNKTGVSVIGQSGNMVPADKKLYALRDVTATIDSVPLISASIMSKKLAAGSDKILLDVTTGSGAFIKDFEQAIELAKTMVAIGEGAGKQTVALITNMDTPLGHNIGNIMEVKEVVELLNGEGPKDLKEVCLHLAANMLYLTGNGGIDECMKLAEETLSSGKALAKFKEMVTEQQGDVSYIEDTEKFKKADYFVDVVAPATGYITHMNTEQCGIASVVLGAGRETKESEIDFSAGIRVIKKTGDYVEVGEPIATLYSSSFDGFSQAAKILLGAYTIGKEKPEPEKLILARVTIDGVERF